MNYEDFFNAIPIPWLTRGPNGIAFWKAWGQLLQDQADRLKSGVKASFPTSSPDDALPFLSDEFGVLQAVFGSFPESNDDFRARLKNSWSFWPYAGSPLGPLLALYFLGYGQTVQLRQQNGLIYSIGTSPLPTDLTFTPDYQLSASEGFWKFNELLSTTLAGLFVNGDKYLYAINSTGAELVEHQGTGAGTITVAGTFVATHSLLITIVDQATSTYTYSIDNLPAVTQVGNLTNLQIMIPWWSFDGNDALVNRYAIVFTQNPGWWDNITNPPSSISTPTISEVNTIWKAVQLWGPAKARCINIDTSQIGGGSIPPPHGGGGF